MLSAHKALVNGISAGQAEKVARLARRHLQESQHYALADGSDRVVRATTLRSGFDRFGS